ncbi:hypothetical protein V5P93_006421 [Actinokineospora auranticolor]|uniref:Uncharacterized protein n=1 Tax=Actinokineospora auranticolor TaxID=155976 RepID=A0A2S6GFM0_9PSEU|nr:hypothetical protein [Actinokineospora auranticolor]PPK64014.1 hypothetical protein CLV40_1225 [Actinokineospora auranticolor]
MARRSVLRAAVAALPVLLTCTTAGCDGGRDDWSCTRTRCEVTVTGTPTLEVLDARLKAEVGRGLVRVVGGGVDVTLAPGEAALVDGVRVEVRAVTDAGAATLVLTG